MGTATQHLEKAESHLRFLDIIPDAFPVWLITVAFYEAVELAESLLADRGIHSKSHEERKRSIREQFPSIHAPYHALYNASMDARYEPLSHCPSVEDVRRELLEKRLKHVRSFFASHTAIKKEQ